MNRRTTAGILGAVVVLAGILLLISCGDEEVGPQVGETASEEVIEVTGDDVDLVPVELYFPDQGGLLSAEEREVAPWTTAEQGARTLLLAVLAGPEDPSLSAPLPPEATLGAVHLTEASVLYVDLISTELARPPSTGSQMELLSIWSLVDTVVLGVPEIDSVVLLWNSRQLSDFGGHVDTSLPLSANRGLLRTRR